MNIEQGEFQDLRKHLKDQVSALDRSAIVAITNARGVITYANPMFCELSEYSSEELVGKTHKIINSGYHDKTFFAQMWQTISSGQVWRGEICNRAKSGKIYWVDTTIVPFVNDEDQVEQYVAIRYDISSRKKAEENLKLERAKLVEAEKMASIGVLAAGIAHELGNPLGAIRGRLEMLEAMIRQPNFEKELALSSIGKMIDSVDRMSKIIRGLKSSSRDGSQDAMQDFDVSQLVSDILEISVQKCRKENISVRTSGLDRPKLIKGRETEIGQVVVNLFNNAIDAIKGQDNAYIEIHLLEDESDFILKVRDSGEGVPLDIQNRIFDPFFTTKEVGRGTGLGLSICRSFVETHHGSLEYTKEEGVSSFVVRLPKLQKS